MSQFAKIEQFIQQNRFTEAEQEIRLQLLDDPNNGNYYTLLAACFAGMNKPKEALLEARKGLSLNPDSAYAFYILSKCFIGNLDYNEAEKASLQALQLCPEHEFYLCNHAFVLNALKKHDEALETINNALSKNPEHRRSKQIKSVILRSKGKYDEADNIAGDALKDAPENALAFLFKGWSLLDNKKNKEALECFKSAAMIAPNNQHVKSCLVMGIKAQSKLFDIYYRYHKWVYKLNPMVGGFMFMCIILLSAVAYFLNKIDSEAALLFNVILGVFLLIIFLIWTIDPIFNVLLRFNRYGRYALNKAEIIGSNIIAALIVIAALLSGAHYLFEWFPIRGAIGALLLIIPVSFAISQWNKTKFKKNVIVTAILTIFWLLNIVLPIVGFDTILPWIAFIICIFALTKKAQK